MVDDQTQNKSRSWESIYIKNPLIECNVYYVIEDFVEDKTKSCAFYIFL